MFKKLNLCIYFFIVVSCNKSFDGFAPSVQSISNPPALVTPVPFTPIQITGIHTWFDASDVALINTSSGKIISWLDKYNNLIQLSQSTAASQPAYQSNVINGKNAAYFDGIDDSMQANIVNALGSEITISYVVQLSNFANKIPFTLNTTNYSYGPDIYFSGGKLAWNTGDSIVNAFSNSAYPSLNAPHIITIKNSQISNTASLYLDTVFIGTANYRNTIITDFSAPRIYIGNWVTGSYFMNGYFAELIIYNKVISETERADMEFYLKNKWGIL